MKRDAKLIRYVEIIVRWRRFIVLNFIVLVVLSAAVSFLLPEEYVARSTVLPPDQNQGFGLSPMLGTLGIPALSFLQGSTSSEVYKSILESHYVQSSLVDKFDLVEKFDLEELYEEEPGVARELAMEILLERTSIDVSLESGVVAVSVSDEDPQLAADLTNAYIRKLDEFNRQVTMTKGKKSRIFLEERLQEARDDLAKVEEEFKIFQEKHGLISLEDELVAAIKFVADLKAQLVLSQIRLDVLRETATSSNPELRKLENEVEKIQKQLLKIEKGSEERQPGDFGVPLEEVPDAALEYARFLRDVEIKSQIVIYLQQEYEQAKIQEARDTPTVQVLDYAEPPAIPDWPKKRLIVAVTGLFALILGVIGSFVFDFLERIRRGEQADSERWMSVYSTIDADTKHILRRFLERFRK